MIDKYRDYDEQYKYADRNFRMHDIVVFVGPPPDSEQFMMISNPMRHKLYLKKGRVARWISEDIYCYPDEPKDSDLARMIWVKFEDDDKEVRQVDKDWLVKENDFRWD